MARGRSRRGIKSSMFQTAPLNGFYTCFVCRAGQCLVVSALLPKQSTFLPRKLTAYFMNWRRLGNCLWTFRGMVRG